MTSGESRAETIGSILKFLRNNLGLKQKDVAEKVGIAQQTYAGYESGRHEPSIELAIRLASLYRVTLDFITGRYKSDDDNDLEQHIKESNWLEFVLPLVKLQMQMEEQYMKAGMEQAKAMAAEEAMRITYEKEGLKPLILKI